MAQSCSSRACSSSAIPDGLETIVAEVQEIKRQVCAIVESAQEQSSGLRQINTAVNQLDQDTQKNAATVEEAIAANYSLANEVRTLESSQCPRRRGNGSLAAIEGEVRAFCTALGYDRFVPFSAFAAQDEMVARCARGDSFSPPREGQCRGSASDRYGPTVASCKIHIRHCRRAGISRLML